LKFRDRLRLAFKPHNGIMEVLQQYASDFIKGEDVTASTGYVDSDTALKFAAVFACNRVLAETLASCPVFLYEKQDDGNNRKILKNVPEYDLLHNAPNPEMTPAQFKETGVSNINLGGNFVAQKVRNARGEILQLRPLTYDRVEIRVDKQTGMLNYAVDGKKDRIYTREDMLHIPGLTLDGYIGVTPIEYAQNALVIGVSQETFQRNFYKNGVMVSGVFEHPGELDDESYVRLKKDMTKNYAGLKNAGVPMILEAGMKYKEVSMKLTDAQFIEGKYFQIEDIARMYRVPLHLIGDLRRSTNNNIEHQSLEFLIFTMLPWYKRWEENLNLQILNRQQRMDGWYYEFKVDALLRGDVQTRYAAYALGRQWGWLSVNDIRRLENMNGIGPAGDVYLEPLNMVEAGKEQQSEQAAKMTDEIYKLLKGGEKRDE